MVSLTHRRACVVLGVIILGCSCGSAPPFDLSDYHAEDHFSWRSEGQMPILVVNCPAGIGRVLVSGLNGGTSGLMVELHLDGLENFSVISSQTRYQLAVTEARRVMLEPAENNPLNLVGIPARPGTIPWRVHIDLRPYRHSVDAITLSWIDFYR